MNHESETAYQGIYHGWTVVGAGFLSIAVEASIWISGSLVLIPLAKDTGWSRAEVSLGISFFVLGGGLWAPVVGSVIRKYGPRRVMPPAALLLSAGLLLLSLTQSLLAFSLVMLLFVSVSTIAIGSLGNYTAIQEWFAQKRGTALGLADSGASLGIALLGPIIAQLLLLVGWRSTYQILALIVLLLAPLHLLVQRRLPPPPRFEPTIHTASRSVPRVRELLRQQKLWLILVGAFTISAAAQLVVLHQGAYLDGQGFGPEVIASALAVFGVVGVVGRIGFGWFADAIGTRKVFALLASCVVLGIGCLVLAGQSGSVIPIYLYSILFGVSLGVPMVIFARETANLYGSRLFGTIMGIVVMGGSLGGALGTAAAGLVFDFTGTYLGSFAAAAIAAILSLLCVLVLTRPNTGRNGS